MTLDISVIRKLLADREAGPAVKPLIAALRKQLSNYDRGDDEAKAALKPRILETVEQFSTFQLESAGNDIDAARRY